MEINQIDEKLKDLESEKQKMTQQGKEFDILRQYKGVDRMVLAKDLYEEVLKENEGREIIKTNLPTLDRILGGFVEGQLITISAPTGQGKTTFCQTLTMNFSEQGIKSAWFSYEVGIQEFLDKFPEIPVCYMPRQTRQNNFMWLETRIKESIAKYDSKIVFIDHLHYLLEMAEMAKAKSISLLVGMLMRDLKRIAIENNIVIFLVSHMKKSVYSQAEDIPDINDLRDSSFIGQESDAVLFLFRKPSEVEGEYYTTETLLKVAKNRRTGNLGCVKLNFANKKFEELSINYEQNDF